MRNLLTATAAAVLMAGPAMAQVAWVDITTAVTSILGKEGSNGPYYLRNGSVKTVKSVNFKGTIYKRGEFSYSSYGSTKKVDYLFDCSEASYKLNDGQPGYYQDISWITPGYKEDSIQWIAYKYLCPSAKTPWLLLTKDSEGAEFWVNSKAGYSEAMRRYGKVYVYVTAKTEKIGDIQLSPKMSRLYVSCSAKRVGFYELAGYAPQGNNIELDEPNPGSIGEQMVDIFCSK